MSSAISALNFKFNGEDLLSEWQDLEFDLTLELEDDPLTQILLTHRPNDSQKERWTYGAGSLWSEAMKRHWARTSMFSKLDDRFCGTAIGETISEVRDVAATFGKKIGRVRVLTLLPKTCYSLHTDAEEFRFHIPLQTSHSAFFVSGDNIDRMTEIGRLYMFRTNLEHTAVNASINQRRIHLVFDTYE